jgi:hypothetical protein
MYVDCRLRSTCRPSKWSRVTVRRGWTEWFGLCGDGGVEGNLLTQRGVHLHLYKTFDNLIGLNVSLICIPSFFFFVIHLSVVLQPFVGPWQLFIFSFAILYTVGRTPWTGDQQVARPLPTHTGQLKYRIKAYRHPCLEWDSNPRPQCISGRRQFIP